MTGVRSLSCVFHGVIAVAELKRRSHIPEWPHVTLAVRVPRRYCRGRIEACSAESAPARRLRPNVFHGVIAVAELKPGRFGDRRADFRGARISTALIAVAELKRAPQVTLFPGWDAGVFHGLIAVAKVKPAGER